MWIEKVNCKPDEMDLFFSELKSKVAKAKAICSACDVASECLQFALDEEIEHGTFGGYTADERKSLVVSN